jgi:hypothetical protein
MVLEKLHFVKGDSSNEGARQEFRNIQAQLELEKHDSGGSLFRLLQSKRYRRRMWTGFFLQAVGQTTGVLVINNYMVRGSLLFLVHPVILTNPHELTLYGGQIIELRLLGVVGWQPLMINGFYNSWAAFLNFVNAFIVDRIGRIRIITIGIVSSSVSSHHGILDPWTNDCGNSREASLVSQL